MTLLDNTLAGFHNHGQYDVDLFAHSLTKYASGHGDVMGGAIIGSAALIDALRDDVAILGPTLDPHAAFLMLRGMKTYFLRWDAQCRNAQRGRGIPRRPSSASSACVTPGCRAIPVTHSRGRRCTISARS